ncbi:hypothetical protein HQ45_00935 [Porphyromonas crevioricanis]|uniref:Uncharacterized protein n=1 Tax=Porphyromonas crevioricanis TaxID=393921 RepID=A0A0A2FIA3_9PORP|nr:hypothetical protein HQ45_00935 [Porphyromonas crevioricanis]SQH72834.1 Uncharacterised protein [Porphyromonas crevioricanis]
MGLTIPFYAFEKFYRTPIFENIPHRYGLEIGIFIANQILQFGVSTHIQRGNVHLTTIETPNLAPDLQVPSLKEVVSLPSDKAVIFRPST